MKRKLVGLLIVVFFYSESKSLVAQELAFLEKMELVQLNSSINSRAEEVKPVLNETGDKMYFVRAFHAENVEYEKSPHNEDIWMVEKDSNDLWLKPKPVKSLNDEKNNSIIGKGIDNHVFLLNTYKNKKKLEYGIAISKENKLGSWNTPVAVDIPNLNYVGDFYDFYITHDESALIISMEGKESFGKEDLYVTMKDEQGKWKKPLNLGSVINSTGYEMSPFLTEDKRYLYFSTNGRMDGLGNADVYVSERLGDGWNSWSEPKNLGFPINSADMDCYFTMNNANEIFFSSNRNKKNGLDIYSIQPKKIIENAIAITDCIPDTLVRIDTVYITKSSGIKTQAKRESYSIKFDFGSSSIDFDVYNLNEISTVLLENPKQKTMLVGNTDSLGSDEFNLMLSYKRVQNVKSKLIMNGVNEEQLMFSYNGEFAPKKSNSSYEGRKENRTVDIIFISDN